MPLSGMMHDVLDRPIRARRGSARPGHPTVTSRCVCCATPSSTPPSPSHEQARCKNFHPPSPVHTLDLARTVLGDSLLDPDRFGPSFTATRSQSRSIRTPFEGRPNRSRPTRAALRGRAPQAAIDSSALRRPLDRSRSPSHAPAGHGIEVSTDLDPSRRPPRAVASSPPCLRRPARSITTALERPVTPRDPVASSLARPPRPPRSIATASGRLDNARSPGFLPHCRLVEARCRKGPQTCSSISTSRRWSGSPRRG